MLWDASIQGVHFLTPTEPVKTFRLKFISMGEVEEETQTIVDIRGEYLMLTQPMAPVICA